MTNEQQQIRDFMTKAQQATPDRPTVPKQDVRLLRLKLIAEELQELAAAFGYRLYLEDDSKGIGEPTLSFVPNGLLFNIVESYDAILDLMVVVIGAGVALGLELEPGWQEVHRSNMSKFIDGHRRTDGKWIKGPSYSSALLEPIIEAQYDNKPVDSDTGTATPQA
jgi:predicted HAD superfamily Cof-like phosphohydrolase